MIPVPVAVAKNTSIATERNKRRGTRVKGSHIPAYDIIDLEVDRCNLLFFPHSFRGKKMTAIRLQALNLH